jgi:hypothetical protein
MLGCIRGSTQVMLWNACLGFFSLRYIQISLYLNSKYHQRTVTLLPHPGATRTLYI